jgi:hypothetical protein
MDRSLIFVPKRQPAAGKLEELNGEPWSLAATILMEDFGGFWGILEDLGTFWSTFK